MVDEVVAGRAVPAGLEKGAARGVPGGFRLVGVPGPPSAPAGAAPGELGALGGQLVGGPGGPLRVGRGNQQPFPLQPLEALGEDVRGDPGDLAEQVIEPLRPAEQVIEPLRPAEQRPGQQQRPLVTDPGQRPASGDEPFSCSAMSGS